MRIRGYKKLRFFYFAELDILPQMHLEEISIEHEQSFLAMIDDYRKHDPQTLATYYPGDWNQLTFRKFVKECEKSRMDWRPKPGKVAVTHYVLRDPQGVISAGARMRFPLDDNTEYDGGNLEVDVPPSLRKQNNGSFALSLLLFEAVRAGLRRALCTCPASDQAARRIIEKNRGQLQDIVGSPTRNEDIARYWISFRGS